MDFNHGSVFLGNPHIDFDTGNDVYFKNSKSFNTVATFARRVITRTEKQQEIVVTDFCITSNSKVVVITAGVKQTKGEKRLDLVHRNSEIFKNIVPPLVSYSPNAVFVIVSNPG